MMQTGGQTMSVEKKNEENTSQQSNEEKKKKVRAEILSWVEVIVVAVVLALFIDNVIIINATIPSGSMEKTIMTGDRIIGARFLYWFNDPARGDIVVFKYPIDEAKGLNTKFIKRVIGLPGETVEIKDGAVYIDGDKLEEDYINGTWVVENDGYRFDVPEDHYLMLGDNRNNSSDARYWPSLALKEGVTDNVEEALTFSYVQRKKILGKALFCYWPFRDFGSLYS
jgi:signal peptidase I